MPWTDADLPFASSASPLAGQASFDGATAASGRAANQTIRLLELYAKWGPLNDRQAARLLEVERSTINARRVPLCQRGIVVAVDTMKNEDTGVLNTRWGLAK